MRAKQKAALQRTQPWWLRPHGATGTSTVPLQAVPKLLSEPSLAKANPWLARVTFCHLRTLSPVQRRVHNSSHSRPLRASPRLVNAPQTRSKHGHEDEPGAQHELRTPNIGVHTYAA